jgi:hypothetical protein
MTQLARPDLARRGQEREHIPPAAAERRAAGRAIPAWAVVTALAAPAVLAAGWLAAGALQPASYSPIRQTMSVLAGYSGTDRWVMTAALLMVGCCQIATGAGLTRVGLPARLLLVLTGLSTLGIAASPEPAAGPTARHLAFAVSCVVTTGIWPLLVARRGPDRPWILSVRTCAAVTVLFAGLSCWLLIAAQGGSDLGLAERMTSEAQGLFPFLVAIALQQAARAAASESGLARRRDGTARVQQVRLGGHEDVQLADAPARAEQGPDGRMRGRQADSAGRPG